YSQASGAYWPQSRLLVARRRARPSSIGVSSLVLVIWGSPGVGAAPVRGRPTERSRTGSGVDLPGHHQHVLVDGRKASGVEPEGVLGQPGRVWLCPGGAQRFGGGAEFVGGCGHGWLQGVWVGCGPGLGATAARPGRCASSGRTGRLPPCVDGGLRWPGVGLAGEAVLAGPGADGGEADRAGRWREGEAVVAGGVGAALVVDVGEEPAQRGDGHGAPSAAMDNSTAAWQ